MRSASWIPVALVIIAFQIAVFAPASTLGLIDFYDDTTQVAQRSAINLVSGEGIVVTSSDSAANSRVSYTLAEGILAESGSATLAAAATTTVVTHGLGQAPDRVLVTPTSDTLGARWWVSATSTTTFTIEMNTTTASDVTFDWRAQEEEE